MDYSIEELNGSTSAIIRDGADVHQIPIAALASWGALLGMDDSGDVLDAILAHWEPLPVPGPNAWTPLYDVLGAALTEMSKAGVPPEFMADLLDPSLGAPVPAARTMSMVARAQEVAPMGATLGPVRDLGELRSLLRLDYAQEIADQKTAFLDAIAPTFTIDKTEQEGTA